MPYRLYVIELNKKVLSNKKFMSDNPDYIPGKPCLYVGQTARAPEVRFQQHLNGYKANRYARDYGIRLYPNIVDLLDPFKTRAEAEEAEAKLAKSLRKFGYAVWYG
ncbi:MAG: GIY-YIG nuclease family protein [Dehalococcoidia bacterium]